MDWAESRPYGDYYTLFELRCDGEASHAALAEFWRGVLTTGRRLSAGWNWRWLVFRVSCLGTISAWFSEATTHRRLVPVLFTFVCPAIEREYDRLPQLDGDVTEEAADQFVAGYGRRLARAAEVAPIPQLLREWRLERTVPVELELLDGYTLLEV